MYFRAQPKLILLTVFLLSSCASPTVASPVPTEDSLTASSPVQVTVLTSDEFSILNNTLAPIYYQQFPTEVLPLIDWAPCQLLEDCQNIEILPGNAKTFLFSDIQDRGSESISLFWWHISEDQGEPNPDYFYPQEINIPIP